MLVKGLGVKARLVAAVEGNINGQSQGAKTLEVVLAHGLPSPSWKSQYSRGLGNPTWDGTSPWGFYPSGGKAGEIRGARPAGKVWKWGKPGREKGARVLLERNMGWNPPGVGGPLMMQLSGFALPLRETVVVACFLGWKRQQTDRSTWCYLLMLEDVEHIKI
jgi:hypothetical protein